MPLPLVPVTVTVYCPALKHVDGAMVRVEVLGSEVGVIVALNPVGAEAAKLTASVNPLSAFTVMVEVTGVGFRVFIVNVFGEADILKSGVGGAPKLMVMGLPIPVTRSYPDVQLYAPFEPVVMSVK